MGFLTTITLRNDKLHDMEANPEAFARDLFAAIDKANEHHMAYDLDNRFIVQPSRHADDHAIFVHKGNSVLDITGRRMDKVTKELPEVAKEYVDTAQSIVTWAKKRLKGA